MTENSLDMDNTTHEGGYAKFTACDGRGQPRRIDCHKNGTLLTVQL